MNPQAAQLSLSQRLERLRSAPMGPHHDPWDPILTAGWSDRPLLTSIEVTVTHQCNLRCDHCAVGEVLAGRDVRTLSLDRLIARLDEVDTLVTFSLTGGEPAASAQVVREVVRPLLAYAKSRGLRTQVNTNLTLPFDRYESFAELVDVMHISYNAVDPEVFARIVYAKAEHLPARPEALFERLEENVRRLASAGCFVSAETILSEWTMDRIDAIHARLAELGCRRHEIHPLYPSDYAATMRLPSLEELARAARRLLAARDPNVWILFGTFPFFACSPEPEHRELLLEVLSTPNTTVRNDPDGRCRLNVSSLTGDVLLQDFADVGPLGNIEEESFIEIWERWLGSERAARLHCACPQARCLGPNLIVADVYFPGVSWRARRALVGVEA